MPLSVTGYFGWNANEVRSDAIDPDRTRTLIEANAKGLSPCSAYD